MTLADDLKALAHGQAPPTGDPLALPPAVERLARAVSRLCWRTPGWAIPAGEIEREAGVVLSGEQRRIAWQAVRLFYAADERLTFHRGAVCWRPQGGRP